MNIINQNALNCCGMLDNHFSFNISERKICGQWPHVLLICLRLDCYKIAIIVFAFLVNNDTT